MMEVKQMFEELLSQVQVPEFARLRLELRQPGIENVELALKEELAGCGAMERIRPGDTVAVAVGSREIADMAVVVRTIVKSVKDRGGEPFIVPAMGSHGGATARGQEEVLRHFGITKETVGAPVRSSMETVKIGETGPLSGDAKSPDRGGAGQSFEVHMDKLAAEADHIIPVGRIKAHTDFRGPVESGLMKMIVIGLGKQHGASICHRLGFPKMSSNILEFGRVILERAPILLGVCIIENASHQIAHIEAVPGREIPKREPKLLEMSKALMPKIPVGDLDVLVVSEMGKEISGAGMDPNITGRSCVLGRFWPDAEKIAVLDLTDKSDGNAAGMGNADAITRRMYGKINLTPIYINGLTCRDTEGIRLPAVMESDLLALKFCLHTCIRRPAMQNGRIAWIRNTADLENIYISEALVAEAEKVEGVTVCQRNLRVVERGGQMVLSGGMRRDGAGAGVTGRAGAGAGRPGPDGGMEDTDDWISMWNTR